MKAINIKQLDKLYRVGSGGVRLTEEDLYQLECHATIAGAAIETLRKELDDTKVCPLTKDLTDHLRNFVGDIELLTKDIQRTLRRCDDEFQSLHSSLRAQLESEHAAEYA